MIEVKEAGDCSAQDAELKVTVRKSKKGIRKLKKKPFSPVGTAEQLEAEINAAQGLLGAIDTTMAKVAEEADKIDPQRTVQIATGIVKKAGFNVKGQQPPSFDKVKAVVVVTLRRTMLTTLSIAIASLLDPLESITRYLDSQHSSFDDSSPYVKHFRGLYEVVARLLEKSQEMNKEKV